MKSFIQKIIIWSKVHKIISVVILLALIGAGYGTVLAFSSDTSETRYVLATLGRGDIVASVTGSGQVSSFDQVDLTAKTSGDLVSVNVKTGQEVGSGAIIAQIDSGDAYYDFETAKLSYEELVTIDPDDVVDAEEDVEDAYTTARTAISTASISVEDIMEDLKTLFNCNNGYLGGCNNYSTSAKQFRTKAETAWFDANDSIYSFTKKYRIMSNSSTRKEIEDTVKLARDTATAVFEAAKYSQDAAIYFKNNADNETDQTKADEAYSLVSPLVSSANTVLSDLTTAQNGIKDSEKALVELKDGADVLDIRSSELSLRQKQDALSDYVIKSPFAGIVASIDVKKGDTVNSGTTIATLITKKKIAEISLNEIDVAKVKVGQKATLTFDAFDDLTIGGEVTEVDLVGTVSQGVVNYVVKIAFDTDDSKVKSGMTVNASIITEMRQNTLVVPTSAVKTQSSMSYVEVIDQSVSYDKSSQTTGILLTTSPRKVKVTTGFTDDESIEIVSGLEEGQQYVVRTITTTVTATQSTQTAPSLFGNAAGSGRTSGSGGFGGGNMPR
ncbi:MAG: HlyD family efflux transporter periplasmic adaptor subunit [Candidatus Paceibacterota bacterium]|jgi:HlyD family secretion protein